ncbi:hypothetical protein [Nocardia brasiliensis]|uniref:hypothetical protein n=1 Tax=Nocardia brasiliensis TaxID=37326 RepID=UPI0024538AE6|nr:hypothetical protein [Nocardia brasiliensis]
MASYRIRQAARRFVRQVGEAVLERGDPDDQGLPWFLPWFRHDKTISELARRYLRSDATCAVWRMNWRILLDPGIGSAASPVEPREHALTH